MNIDWNPVETAPKDGIMLRLLVRFTDNATEDSEECVTIGFNSLEDSLEDSWFIAGWNWQQDCFTEGIGEVIGWLPYFTHADYKGYNEST